MFPNHNESVWLKYCINRLISMSYQCTFGILQVTQYSVCIQINFDMTGRAVWRATDSSSLFSTGSKIRSKVAPDASSHACLLYRGWFLEDSGLYWVKGDLQTDTNLHVYYSQYMDLTEAID